MQHSLTTWVGVGTKGRTAHCSWKVESLQVLRSSRHLVLVSPAGENVNLSILEQEIFPKGKFTLVPTPRQVDELRICSL